MLRRASLSVVAVAALGVIVFWSVKVKLAHVQPDTLAAAEPSRPAFDEATLMRQATLIFRKLPDQMPGSENDTTPQVELGRKLYFETALSINRTQSCNTCHPIDGNQVGVDNLPTSPGALGELGTRNTPTVFNAGYHMAQFWDGRAKDLAEQAMGPPLNPVEMAMPSAEAIEQRLRESDYPAAFAAAFPDEQEPVTFENVGKAIAAFERTLISKSRFDDYLAGDSDALTLPEKRGLHTFITRGCVQCHMGPTLGGTLYQKTGIYRPYPNSADLGRFDVTGNEQDKHVFKVPSLRNVALTWPYFHDGGVTTLAEAVDLMAQLQLNADLSDEEVEAIAQFLRTLTDEKLKPANE